MSEERASYVIKDAYRPPYGGEVNAALKKFIQQVGDDMLTIEKKIDTVLACLTCPKCDGSGVITIDAEVHYTDKGMALATLPIQKLCSCRITARAVLGE